MTGGNPLVARLKEAGTHTIIYGLGSALQTVLGFVLIPLYTRYYTPEIYGVLTLVVLVGTIGGSIFWFGISTALARSYYDYPTEHERKIVFSTSLYVTLLGALLQALLGVFLARDLSHLLFGTSRYGPPIAVALLSSALTFVNTVFFMLLRFQRRSAQFVSLNIGSFVVTAGLIMYLLIQLHLGVMAPILGTCLGQAMLCAILFYISRGYVVREWYPHELPVQLRFGIPAVLIGLAYYVLDQNDRIFIQHYGSLRDVGVYSLGYKVGTLIQPLLILPFSQIWAPMRIEYRHEAHAGRLFKLILTYYCMIGLFLTAAISVFSRELVRIVAGPEYFAAYRVIPYVMLGHLAYGAINILDSGIIFERKVMYHVYVFTIGLLANAVLNAVFIPRLGYIAAAYTTLFSYVLVAVLVAIVSNRLFRIQWEPGRLCKLLASSGFVMAASMLLPGTNAIAAFLTKAVLLALLATGWYWLVLTEPERRHLGLALRGATANTLPGV